MEVDEELMTPLEVTVITQSSQSSALEFDLRLATFTFLQQIGILPSSEVNLTRSSYINVDTYTTIQSYALINSEDALTLLSILPFNLWPELPFQPSPPSSSTVITRGRVLDTLARLSLEPSLTLPILRRFRPLAPHFFGRWLEMLNVNLTTGEFTPSPRQGYTVEQEIKLIEKVMRAMIRVLSVFENVFP